MELRRACRSIGILIALVFSACDAPRERADAASSAEARHRITETLEHYQEAARRVDASAMAAFYAPNGVLFEPGIPPIVTRDSIRAFLASFPGVTVHTATATPDTIDVFGGRAYMWGSYFEHLSFPGQPTSQQHGKFVMEWARQPTGEWLIARLYRIPLPARPPAPGS